jgi:hypothetical protein
MGSGKSPGEIQGEKIGKGCVSVLFSAGPYIIVFYFLFNLIIDTTDILSSNYNFIIPEWIHSAAILITSGFLFFCKKYIGQMALLSIVILIGIHYFFEGEVNKPTTAYEKKVVTRNVLTHKQRAINAIKDSQKNTMTFTPPRPESECRPCALVINSKSVSADIKNKQRKVCEPRRKKCASLGVIW